MTTLVEHLLEELELCGRWEDEDQQDAEERLEEHFRFDLFRQLLYARCRCCTSMSSASSTAGLKPKAANYLGIAERLPHFLLRKLGKELHVKERSRATDEHITNERANDTTPQPTNLAKNTATMHLMYTMSPAGERIYTLKKVNHGEVTKSAHPARFSPDDKYSRYE